MNNKIIISALVLTLAAVAALILGRGVFLQLDGEASPSEQTRPATSEVNDGASLVEAPSRVGTSRVGPHQRIASLYTAADIRQLNNRRIETQGDLRADAEYLAYYGEDICNYFDQTLVRSFADPVVSSRYGTDADSVASYEKVDQFRQRFCINGTDSKREHDPLVIDRALATASAQSSRLASVLLDARAEVLEGGHAPSAALQRDLLSVVRTTESPLLMIEAASLLGTGLESGFTPPGYDASGLSESQRMKVSIMGAQLAACKAFEYCGRQTVMSLRACLPMNCRGQATMHDYFRHVLSPHELAATNRYANALVTLRREGSE